MASRDKEYTAALSDLVDSDTEDHESEQTQRWLIYQRSFSLHKYRYRLLALALVAITAIVIGTYLHYSGARVLQCGTTAEEARSRGCIFETTSFSWLPPACTDAEVETEFQADSSVQFFKDVNYTQMATAEEVRSGNGAGYFVTHAYHQAHCAFLLKKLHRAYARKGPIDGLIISLHHTSHCVKMLLDPPSDVWTHPAFAYTKFPYCGKQGGYNVEWGRQGEWTR